MSPTSKESHVVAITLHELVDKIDAEAGGFHSRTQGDPLCLCSHF
jgi:hypothetical protein